jgi:methionyl-tRNA formyltransferase
MTVRLAFLGNDAWSVPPLEAIAGEPDLQIALTATNPPKPAGRGSQERSTPVADAARRLGVPLVETDRVGRGAGLDALVQARPDVVVVVAFGELLTREVLELAPLGAINLHFSLLPRWRGAAPVQHALLAGDTLTGVSVMQMDEGLDTGPVLNQLEEEIRPDDDAGTLGARLAHLGGLVLVGVLRRLSEKGLPARPQDNAHATVAPRLDADDRRLHWRAAPEAIVRRVRAMSPEPGATTSFRGDVLKVLAAGVAHDPPEASLEPGRIVAADDRGVLIAAEGGGVRLIEVAPAGRKRMPASAWARGARFDATERLG